MSTPFEMKTGDRLKALLVQIIPGDASETLDLAGKTVSLSMRAPNGTKVIDGAPMTVVKSSGTKADPPTASYDFADGETDLPGQHLIEVVVSAGGLDRTFPSASYGSILIAPRL